MASPFYAQAMLRYCTVYGGVKLCRVKSLGLRVSVEVFINISFGLELSLVVVFLFNLEVIMNNLNIIIKLVVCAWCEVALLRCLVATSTLLEIGIHGSCDLPRSTPGFDSQNRANFVYI